jgi:hypothetical protein
VLSGSLPSTSTARRETWARSICDERTPVFIG